MHMVDKEQTAWIYLISCHISLDFPPKGVISSLGNVAAVGVFYFGFIISDIPINMTVQSIPVKLFCCAGCGEKHS